MSSAPGPRVLVVSPIEGGSLPIARYAAEAFAELGASVVLADFSWLSVPDPFRAAAKDPAARAELVEYASSLLLRLAERERPELCFALAQAPIHRPAVDALGRLGATTAFWFVENHRVTRYWREVAKDYDWFFTAQRGGFHEQLVQAGCARPRWLPLAASPTVHAPLRLDADEQERFGSDVCFAGYGYFNRREMLRGILDFDLKVWGPGFEGSALEPRVQRGGAGFDADDFARMAAASPVHVNLHSATHVAGVDPDGDYLNPRVFELAACGAFQLCDRRSDLEDAFRVPEEIEVFDDLEGLRAKLAYYLANESERRTIAAASRVRVLSEHTYRHRMATVLEATLGREKARSSAAPLRFDLDGYPRLAEAGLRQRSDLDALVRRLQEDELASDDEILLRLAGVTGERRP